MVGRSATSVRRNSAAADPAMALEERQIAGVTESEALADVEIGAARSALRSRLFCGKFGSPVVLKNPEASSST